jgi:hypothetical protein
MKLVFPPQIFEKFPKTKFNEYPSRRSPVAPCGRTDKHTDRYDEANSRSSQFFERAYRKKNATLVLFLANRVAYFSFWSTEYRILFLTTLSLPLAKFKVCSLFFFYNAGHISAPLPGFATLTP